MKLCWQKVSATQFAIYMAGANIGLSMGAGAYAALESTLAANEIFQLLGLVFFIGVAVVWMTDFTRHGEQVSLLDAPGRTGDFAPHA
jgi:PAT family beta-lactamase induction signal transducer AmpG